MGMYLVASTCVIAEGARWGLIGMVVCEIGLEQYIILLMVVNACPEPDIICRFVMKFGAGVGML